MASCYKFLLFWNVITGLRVPHVLFVSLRHSISPAEVLTNPAFSMRYSRYLEESSFANRKADYFWLLFTSAIMLLVRPSSIPRHPPSLTRTLAGAFPALQPPIPILPARFRSHLHLGAPASERADLALRPHHDSRALPTVRARRLYVAPQRHVARRRRRPHRLRGRARWLVRARRMDARDARRPNVPQRRAGRGVSLPRFCCEQ